MRIIPRLLFLLQNELDATKLPRQRYLRHPVCSQNVPAIKINQEIRRWLTGSRLMFAPARTAPGLPFPKICTEDGETKLLLALISLETIKHLLQVTARLGPFNV